MPASRAAATATSFSASKFCRRHDPGLGSHDTKEHSQRTLLPSNSATGTTPTSTPHSCTKPPCESLKKICSEYPSKFARPALVLRCIPGDLMHGLASFFICYFQDLILLSCPRVHPLMTRWFTFAVAVRLCIHVLFGVSVAQPTNLRKRPTSTGKHCNPALQRRAWPRTWVFNKHPRSV
jgi:hypothetical protein